ncbi:acyltransferase family protein [Alcaligenes endophyticus]|uniref:Acyltransferase n=1 Tax=Alcaligenes endophyticus TaxID=1929088 RepID=A0ABT8EJ14_9BURK|nr:acyltransferase family protein [Alcaligenes endophyticus]MCX5591602.1 acyltransferase family protein [Alcaligenes endophyticus]MDN4121279.1 acyltransferase [Alcaligenes endophyticus]
MSAPIASKYRADIDGLRTIAVMSVFLFHANSSWMPGGYIGVDIFFVISGFLITRIIAREIENGDFSLKMFYVRRIRRILPVFYTVVLASIFVGAWVLLPEDLHSLLDSARYAVFFAANVYFAQDKGYFDISADEKPLLHLWSLSIEEQYYFVWPLLLMLLYALASRWNEKLRALKENLIIGFTALFVIAGFVYTQYMLITRPGDANTYFLLQFRFGELMIGSLTALLAVWKSRLGMRMLAYAGAILVFLGLWTLDRDSVFPGVNALYPCVGAAFIIYSGQAGGGGGSTAIHRWLGLKPMSLVGLLSYSIYLWHWPILAFMRYVYGSYSLPWQWILYAFVFTFALAFLSYYLIERNTKGAKLSLGKAFICMFLIPAALVYVVAEKLEASRPVTPKSLELANYGTDVCHGVDSGQCVRGDRNLSPTVLVTGDSHAAMFNSFIDVVGKHEGWAAVVRTGSSCSPVFGFNETLLPVSAQQPCADLKEFVEESYGDYQAVIFASYWAYQLGLIEKGADPLYLTRLEQTLRSMAERAPVYVLSDVPRLPVHPFRQEHFSRIGLLVDRQLSALHMQANEVIRKIVEKIPNVYWIDLSAALSGFDYMSIYSGKPVYFDDNHLNVYGSSSLGELFIRNQPPLLTNR